MLAAITKDYQVLGWRDLDNGCMRTKARSCQSPLPCQRSRPRSLRTTALRNCLTPHKYARTMLSTDNGVIAVQLNVGLLAADGGDRAEEPTRPETATIHDLKHVHRSTQELRRAQKSLYTQSRVPSRSWRARRAGLCFHKTT